MPSGRFLFTSLISPPLVHPLEERPDSLFVCLCPNSPTVQSVLRESQIICESKEKQIAELKKLSDQSADSIKNEWEKKVGYSAVLRCISRLKPEGNYGLAGDLSARSQAVLVEKTDSFLSDYLPLGFQ